MQLGLDVIGIVDPTPICDGINALISLGRGDGAGAALSAISMVPYAGDVIGKSGKVLRYGIKLADAGRAAKGAPKQADEIAAAAIRAPEARIHAPQVPAKPSVEFPTRYGIYKRQVERFQHALDEDHVRAALPEKRGEVVKRKASGVPYDHLRETRQAIAGAKRRI